MSRLKRIAKDPRNIFLALVVVGVGVAIATCALDDIDTGDSSAPADHHQATPKKRAPCRHLTDDELRDPETVAKLRAGRRDLDQLSDELSKRGYSGRFSVGTRPDVVLFDGPCSQAILDDFGKRMSFSEDGFTAIECLDMFTCLR